MGLLLTRPTLDETSLPSDSVTRPAKTLKAVGLYAYYGRLMALADINLTMPANKITAIIGPSGCGKSTFVRCLNRLHDIQHGNRVQGKVLLDGQDIYSEEMDLVTTRQKIGMVFQRPNPLPTYSIFDNVAVALRLNGEHDAASIEEQVTGCLKQAALWKEVKDLLRKPALSLSGGQQQRLCIARILAAKPEVMLFDEPCGALDPVSTAKIEDLLHHLRQEATIVIVTHNLQQAVRVADFTAFFLATDGQGELIESGPTSDIFRNASDERTQRYVSGQFG